MEYIILGMFLLPFAMILTYQVIKVAFQILVTLYTQAFSILGWDLPRQYARDNWGF